MTATATTATIERTEYEEILSEPIAGDTAGLQLTDEMLVVLPEGAEYRSRGKRVEVSVRRKGSDLIVEARADSGAIGLTSRRTVEQTASRSRADSASITASERSSEQVEEHRRENGRNRTLIIAIAIGLATLLIKEHFRDRKRKNNNNN